MPGFCGCFKVLTVLRSFTGAEVLSMSTDSITVACPSCGTRCRVPGGVLQFKCPKCATVCRIGGSQLPAFTNQVPPTTFFPNVAVGANPSEVPSEPPAEEDSSPKTKMSPNVVISIAAGIAVTLMLIFVVVALAVMSLVKPTGADENESQSAATPVIVYREVDLPESQRQQIYLDMSIAEKKTTGAKIPLPKDSQVGQFVQENLQKVLDRESTLQGLLNDISNEDLQEIMKEGKAKGW
jgi:predicted RNA-binding Zn-ribbon protein involved in translation (DUF1610 family)